MEELFYGNNIEFKITFTTKCSAGCTTCLNNTIENHSQLDEVLFQRIINEIVNLKLRKKVTVSFYSIGESYLHPSFVELCEWAIPVLHEKGIKTCIVTNGSHVNKIPKNIDKFIFSFNAGKKETYENITKMSFERTYNNILALYKKGEFKKARDMQIHMLCFDENAGEEKDFLNLFEKFKGVKYRFSYKYDNQYGKTEHNGRTEQYKTERKRIPCDYVTSKATIYSNGDVVRCSHDFRDETAYGNLYKNTLLEILKSDEREDVFRKHQGGSFEGICESCDYNSTDECQTYGFVYGMFDKTENAIYQQLRKIKNIIRKHIKG